MRGVGWFEGHVLIVHHTVLGEGTEVVGVAAHGVSQLEADD